MIMYTVQCDCGNVYGPCVSRGQWNLQRNKNKHVTDVQTEFSCLKLENSVFLFWIVLIFFY